MNARVLELLHRPENISKEDISLLQNEINKYPYMQSIRTLQLSAIFNFEGENYQKELTKTAAYTTDKKILYTFINNKKEEEKREAVKFKKIQLSKPEYSEETNISTSIEQVVSIHHFSENIPASSIEKTPETTTEKEISTAKTIIGDTELESPIIDKKENEFSILKQETEINSNEVEERSIHQPKNAVGDTELEKTILEKKENEFAILKEMQSFEEQNLCFEVEEKKSEVVFKTREEDLNFTKETVLEQFDKIAEADSKISTLKPSEISFNGFDSFLPDVKFTVPSVKKEEPKAEIIESNVDENPIEIETEKGEVSFENVENLEISVPKEIEIIEEKQPEIIKEKPSEVVLEEKIDISASHNPVEEKTEAEEAEIEIAPEPEFHAAWKPMNFVANPLDSTLKKTEVSAPKPAEKPIEKKVELVEEKGQERIDTSTSLNIVEEPKTDILEVDKEERPILNVSFFGNNVQEIKKDVSASLNVTEEKPVYIQPEIAQSNIPNFVNTWQNWLKIDRIQESIPSSETPVSKTIQPEKVIEKKAEIIEKFIEENPRISQLKSEVNFVVKEKAEDISHLMTETLAKLYIVQKLYTKAIKGYEILQKKYPEKAEEFAVKIQEIKELRTGK